MQTTLKINNKFMTVQYNGYRIIAIQDAGVMRSISDSEITFALAKYLELHFKNALDNSFSRFLINQNIAAQCEQSTCCGM